MKNESLKHWEEVIEKMDSFIDNSMKLRRLMPYFLENKNERKRLEI
jgi:hypothetical protein